MTAPVPPPLPTPVRVGSLVALSLGLIVSFGALKDLALTANAATLDTPQPELGSLKALVPDHATVVAASRASFRAQLSALEAMQWSRVAILGFLSLSSSLVFVSAMRVRWPLGAHRLKVASLLGTASIVTAVLRTLDGAQLLIVARKGVVAAERLLEQSVAPELHAPPGMNLLLASIASVATTTALVAAFVTLGNYFRSPGVQALFAKLDSLTPEDPE